MYRFTLLCIWELTILGFFLAFPCSTIMDYECLTIWRKQKCAEFSNRLVSSIAHKYMYIQTEVFIVLPHGIVCKSNKSVMVSVLAYFLMFACHLPPVININKICHFQMQYGMHYLLHECLYIIYVNVVSLHYVSFCLLNFPDITDIQCIFWWRLFLQIQTHSQKG